MKSTLIFGDLFSVQDLAPSQTFTKKTLLLLGMYAVLTLCTYGMVTTLSSAVIPTSCAAGEHVIHYPIYDSYGIETGHDTACGKTTRSCTVKSETVSGTIYECPALMRPR